MPTLPKKGSKRIGFSPELRAKPVASLKFYLDSNATRSNSHHACHEKNRGNTSTPPAPASLFHRISANVAWALRQIFSKKRPSSRTSWRGPAQAEVTPSTWFVPPRDSHHSEAMEDCIEFINSSYRKSL